MSDDDVATVTARGDTEVDSMEWDGSYTSQMAIVNWSGGKVKGEWLCSASYP